MTVDSAQQFIEALDHNVAFSTQFSIASPRNLDAIVDFAIGKGYLFTKEDLEAALRRVPQNAVVQRLRQYAR
jgi:predicted ribosomally synthesized peptide with nif11-like leader